MNGVMKKMVTTNKIKLTKVATFQKRSGLSSTGLARSGEGKTTGWTRKGESRTWWAMSGEGSSCRARAGRGSTWRSRRGGGRGKEKAARGARRVEEGSAWRLRR